MPSLQVVLSGLVILSYLVLLGSAVTGLLMLMLKENKSLRLVHRFASIPAILFWICVHLLAILLKTKMLPTFLLFLALVFLGGLTGWTVKPGARRMVHIIFGLATFLLFTGYIFFALLMAV